MTRKLTLILLGGALAAILEAQAGKIDRKDPALDQIVPSGAKIEKLASGFGFVEGPVWMKDGFLLFSDIPNNVILKWTPDGKVTEFRKPSGYTGPPAPEGAYVGSNGPIGRAHV